MLMLILANGTSPRSWLVLGNRLLFKKIIEMNSKLKILSEFIMSLDDDQFQKWLEVMPSSQLTDAINAIKYRRIQNEEELASIEMEIGDKSLVEVTKLLKKFTLSGK